MSRNVLVGVCGGISAYKTCELVREFQRSGCSVRVMMTSAAQKFVTKLSFEALTRQPVATDLFSDDAFGTSHIDLARWANELVIAPATANTISNFATGAATDVVSTVYLAFQGRVTLAPAMNSQMWKHTTVQTNLRSLQDRGTKIVWPAEGELACGEIGPGKMADPTQIVSEVLEQTQSLQGKRVLITTGATREYLDPVRFLSNPSTGKMGISIAQEAAHRGAEVHLVHGPTSEPLPQNTQNYAVTSAVEMLECVQSLLPADYFIGTAAVSDYAPTVAQDQKIKKTHETIQLELKKNVDILSSVTKHKTPEMVVVGFAAETENLIPNAKLKLESKSLDFLVGNYVSKETRGFVKNETSVVFLDRTGVKAEHSNIPKPEVAKHLWNEIEKIQK